MTQNNSANVPDGAFPLVYVPEIKADIGIGDRGQRYQVLAGKFPPADGNLNGKNFWYRSTYRRWQADVLAGRYRKESSPPASKRYRKESSPPATKKRAPNPRRPAREPQTA